MIQRQYMGCGPMFDEYGDYQHSGLCSGSRRNPRGKPCGCGMYDLFLHRLDVQRHDGDQAKRTIRVATCPGCQKRTEFPFVGETVPRELFCVQCGVWASVKEISWDGTDFTKYLQARR